MIFALVAGLIAIKAIVLYGVGRLQGMSGDASRRLAFFMPQGGEFAFVVLTLAVGAALLNEDIADRLAVVVTLSMIATPFLLAIDDVFLRRKATALPEFDAMLREAIQTRIATTDVDAGGDALATVALIGCKLKPSTCFEVVRQSIEVTEEDRTLFTRFQVTGFGRETTCSGAFTNIWCEGDLIR